ncbi:tetrameric acyl-CoA thioesterase [Enemella evansiae]|nr:tetrameric acyl-CoA thioesterase [Enemella evansiae]
MLSLMRYTPTTLKWGMRIWPPFLGAGILVKEIAPDWTSATVELHPRRLNSNIHGTAFGGSLQSMTDAFHALLLIHRLGRGYNVWDAAAETRFIRPGRGVVTARMELSDEELERVRTETADGGKSLPWFEFPITDRHGEVVAQVRRQVYVRRHRGASVPAAG